ncbi:MAG: zinc-dependent peptidase [Burkholderiales bacterium]|nr:zinc-dependent peptidase [Burkholderiales bacterium]
MLRALSRWWRSRSEAAALRRRPIPDDLWKRTLVRYPFLRTAADPQGLALRRMTSLFLDRKEFTAVPPLRLTNDVVVAVAAQACLPVLQLGLHHYDGFVGIVLQPDQVVAHRQHLDEDGVLHEYDEVLSGEAVQGGPVMLSWRDVRGSGRSAAEGYNVVIHEFAHVLDMEDGLADGVPLLPPDIPRALWLQTLGAEYEAFAARVDAGEDTALDPYGAHAPEEFFAVASEALFVAPERLQAEHPAFHRLLARFYRLGIAT